MALTTTQRSEAARHKESEGIPGACRGCGKQWPCLVAVLAEEVADLEAALAVETQTEVNATLDWLYGPRPAPTALGAPYDSDTKAEEEP